MVKIGVVGTGFMGKMHIACYGVLPNVQLVGVADVEVVDATANPTQAVASTD